MSVSPFLIMPCIESFGLSVIALGGNPALIVSGRLVEGILSVISRRNSLYKIGGVGEVIVTGPLGSRSRTRKVDIFSSVSKTLLCYCVLPVSFNIV